jgi:hypothetical protein
MKKILIGLMALASISVFAGEVENLKSFNGSTKDFREELKAALRSDYIVGCISKKGDTSYIFFPDFNSNFRMKVVCENSHRKVTAIAKLKQVNGFDEITVRSIHVEAEDIIK